MGASFSAQEEFEYQGLPVRISKSAALEALRHTFGSWRAEDAEFVVTQFLETENRQEEPKQNTTSDNNKSDNAINVDTNTADNSLNSEKFGIDNFDPQSSKRRSPDDEESTAEGIENDDDSLLVRWPQLFAAMEGARFNRESRVVRQNRSKFHPACHKYAMEIDTKQQVLFNQIKTVAAGPNKDGSIVKVENALEDDLDLVAIRERKKESVSNDDSEDKDSADGENENNADSKDSKDFKTDGDADKEDVIEGDEANNTENETKDIDDSEESLTNKKRSSKDRKKDKKRRKKDKKNEEEDGEDEREKEGEEEVEVKSKSDNQASSPIGADVPEPPDASTRPEPPASIDPRLVNPIFFGYTRDDESEQDKRLEAECAATWDETQVRDMRIPQLDAEMDQLRDRFNKRKERIGRERNNARQRLLKKREVLLRQQEKERDVAKQVMDEKEFEHFVRDWVKAKIHREGEQAEEDKKIRNEHWKEDQVAYEEERSRLVELGDQIQLVLAASDKPKGAALVKFGQEQVQAAKVELAARNTELAGRELELLEAKRQEEDEKNKNKNKPDGASANMRSLLLVAEDQVKQSMQAVQEAKEKLASQEGILERSVLLKDKEDRYIALFYCLAITDVTLGSKLFGMGAFSIAVLVVASCGSSLDRKLTSIMRMFLKCEGESMTTSGFALTRQLSVKLLKRVVGAFESLDIGHADCEHMLGVQKLEVSRKKMLKSKIFRNLKHAQSTDLVSVDKKTAMRKRVVPCPAGRICDIVHHVFNHVAITRSASGHKNKARSSLGANEQQATVTVWEWRQWSINAIQCSKDLATLFCTEWKLNTSSALQARNMNNVHRYRLGLSSLGRVAKMFDKEHLTFRMQLNPLRKLELHERAVAMGADDPLKPDYSKYVPKRKNRFFSNVIPLEHGGFGNLDEYNRNVLMSMAIRLQANWRANRGRGKADFETRKSIFYKAKNEALNEVRERIEYEFAQKELLAAVRVDRIRWDAQVRMKQVKLRAKGSKLDRNDVVLLLIEEQVSVEQAVAKGHFRDMAIERGFEVETGTKKGDNDAGKELDVQGGGAITLPPPPKLSYEEKEKKKRKAEAKLRKQAADAFVRKKGLEKLGLDPNDPTIHDRELDQNGNQIGDLSGKKKSKKKSKKKKKKIQQDVSDGEEEREEEDEGGGQSTRKSKRKEKRKAKQSAADDRVEDDENTANTLEEIIVIDDGDDGKYDSDESNKGKDNNNSTEEPTAREERDDADEKEREASEFKQSLMFDSPMISGKEEGNGSLPSTTIPTSLLDMETRLNLMERGVSLEDVYSVGVSLKEHKVLTVLRRPDPNAIDLASRMRHMSDSLTHKKVYELMQELPSKRLIAAFLHRYETLPLCELEDELVRHFGLLRRDIQRVALCLRSFILQDVEMGALMRLVQQHLDTQRCELSQFSDTRNKTVIDEIIRVKDFSVRTRMAQQASESADALDPQTVAKQVEDELKNKRIVQADKQRQIVNTLKDTVAIGTNKLLKANREDDRIQLQMHAFNLLDSQAPPPPSQQTNPHNTPNRTRKRNSTSTSSASSLHVGAILNTFRIAEFGHGSKPAHALEQWFSGIQARHVAPVLDDDRWNWTDRQRVMDAMPTRDHKETVQKYQAAFNLYSDFIETAGTWAKALIMEKHLPQHKRELQPTYVRTADVGRGDTRPRWEICNIHFKFATDDDGLCNGSDEFSSKFQGHIVRNSIAFAKAKPSRIRIPMCAAIDLNGYRVIATSHLPVGRPLFDVNGKFKKMESDLVYGTDDRGFTTHMSDSALRSQVSQAGKALNLLEHGVRGSKDLLPRFVFTGADTRGFRDLENEEFLMFGFRRLFPPESPDETIHLANHARGQSIMWRQLRPELVLDNPVALSADALSLFSLDCPDATSCSDSVREATQRLVDHVIPEYAAELANRSVEDISKMDVTTEMHRRGINMRHLGFLRSFFWYKLRGSFGCGFNSEFLQTENAATVIGDVQPGDQINFHDNIYNVVRVQNIIENDENCEIGEAASSPKHLSALDRIKRNSKKEIPPSFAQIHIVESLKFSSTGEEVWRGRVKLNDKAKSVAVRLRMLVELLVRTLKSILRCWMRAVAKRTGVLASHAMRPTTTHFLNLITGSAPQSDTFWNEQVLEGVTLRFGDTSLSDLEKSNLRVSAHPVLPEIITKLCMVMGIQLQIKSTNAFKRCYVEHAERIVEAKAKGEAERVQALLELAISSGFGNVTNEKDEAKKEHKNDALIASQQEEKEAEQQQQQKQQEELAVEEGEVIDPTNPNHTSLPTLFDTHLDGIPFCFHFSEADIIAYTGHIKHSLYLLDFAKGMVLGAKGKGAQATTYEDVILADSPVGFWPLHHRVGTHLAINLGSLGLPLCGHFVNCQVGVDGFVQNQWPNRSVRFKRKVNSRIDIPFDRKLIPQTRDQPFSLECWVKPANGKEGQMQTVLMSGRFNIMCTRRGEFCFTIYDANYGVDVDLLGEYCKFELFKWYHLVGTFDGTVAKFYINGRLSDAVDVDSRVRQLTRARFEMMATKEKQRRQNEKNSRDKAEDELNKQADEYFETKAGRLELSAGIKRLIARSESKLRLNKEKAKVLGWKKMMPSEASKIVMEEWVKKEMTPYLQEISSLHKGLVKQRKEDITKHMAKARLRMVVPFKLGCYSSTVKSQGGKSFFVGDMQHVAVYKTALSLNSVTKRVHVATTSQHIESDRWLKQAALCFRIAMQFCYDDMYALNQYAETLCQQAASDPERRLNPNYAKQYRWYINEALGMFEGTSNPDGIVALIYALPGDLRWADIVVQCWGALQRVDPHYFGHARKRTTTGVEDRESLLSDGPSGRNAGGRGGNVRAARERRLGKLAEIPHHFSMDGEIATPEFKACAAAMYKHLLTEAPEFFQALQTKNGVPPLRWLTQLESPTLVCYLVGLVKGNYDLRELDLRNIFFTKDELVLISESLRALDRLNLSDCSAESGITPEDLRGVIERCKFLTHLGLDRCPVGSVDDTVAVALGEYCAELRSVSFSNNKRVSDIGIVEMVKSCTSITHLNVSHCALVSDTSLEHIGKQLQRLKELRVGWCIQITDKGVYSFAHHANGNLLSVLDLSACRKVTDEGVVGLAQTLENLEELSLYYCNKITDVGMKQAMHSLLKLKKVNLGDLYQITSRPFFFDAINDGRPVADAKMLTALQHIDFSDCNLITDDAIIEMSRRARGIRSLSLTGCAKLTDLGVKGLTRDSITGIARGENLLDLDLGFCPNLTDSAVLLLSSGCKLLQRLNLSGCTLITHTSLVELFKGCPGLQDLGLAHVRSVTDDTIRVMCDELWIEHLDISYCGAVTDATLGMLADNFTCLLDLNVSWCRKLTNLGLQALVESYELMQKFECAACDLFSDELLDQLKTKCRKLVVSGARIRPDVK